MCAFDLYFNLFIMLKFSTVSLSESLTSIGRSRSTLRQGERGVDPNFVILAVHYNGCQGGEEIRSPRAVSWT